MSCRAEVGTNQTVSCAPSTVNVFWTELALTSDGGNPFPAALSRSHCLRKHMATAGSSMINALLA